MTDTKDKVPPYILGNAHEFLVDTDGGAWVSGKSSFTIPFRGRPQNAKAWFNDPPNCGPAPDPNDTCVAEAVNVGFFFRPRWFLRVSWNIAPGSVRLLNWSTDN